MYLMFWYTGHQNGCLYNMMCYPEPSEQTLMEKISRPDDCLRSCLHQLPNKDLLLSWLPVVCPVGRPMAGYRAPAAPTRYLSTAI